jgi:hypothetical protein
MWEKKICLLHIFTQTKKQSLVIYFDSSYINAGHFGNWTEKSVQKYRYRK